MRSSAKPVFALIISLALLCVTAPLTSAATQYHESPQLAQLVKEGKLPAVEKRLPKEPLVIKPVEEVGQYGGTWRRIAIGPGDAGIISNRLSYENLVRWSPDGKTVVPNVAKSWEASKDGKSFTFHLRDGMKWSDGQPFTADDILFWYQDVLLNEELTPTFPTWLCTRGVPGKVEKVDTNTIRFSFAHPYGLFPMMLAGPVGGGITQYPKHYLKNFHPKYVPKAELEKAAKAAGFDLWYQFFWDRQSWQNPSCPRIWPWIPKRVPPSTPVVCERNPYYWKVDTKGNQLPYIDNISFDIVSDIETLNVKAVAGEVDMQLRHILWENYTLYMTNRKQGDYRVLKWTSAEGSNALLMFNLNDKDPVLRKLIEDRRFRIALSQAINRDEINEICYLGMGEPRQAAVIKESPYYEEEFAKAYAQYDPARANKILDEMGLMKRDKEGFRLRPDGKTLSLTIEYAPVFGPWRDVVAMVKKYWETVGVKTIVKEESRDLFSPRAMAGDLDVGVWTMDRCFTPLIEMLYWMPIEGGTPPSTGIQYWRWYRTRGKEGEKPPAEIQKIYELYDKIIEAIDDSERIRLAKEIMRINAENIWNIGLVGGLPHIVIVKNNFRNVPEKAISDWLQLTPGNTAPEQYFIKKK